MQADPSLSRNYSGCFCFSTRPYPDADGAGTMTLPSGLVISSPSGQTEGASLTLSLPRPSALVLQVPKTVPRHLLQFRLQICSPVADETANLASPIGHRCHVSLVAARQLYSGETTSHKHGLPHPDKSPQPAAPRKRRQPAPSPSSSLSGWGGSRRPRNWRSSSIRR
jgi:hypothetical protein